MNIRAQQRSALGVVLQGPFTLTLLIEIGFLFCPGGHHVD